MWACLQCTYYEVRYLVSKRIPFGGSRSFLSLRFIYVSLCVCLYATCVQVPTGARGRFGPLELELQAAVSHLSWVMVTELRSAGEQKALVAAEISPACGCSPETLVQQSELRGPGNWILKTCTASSVPSLILLQSLLSRGQPCHSP